MGIRYSREELSRIIAMRHGDFEGQGDNAFIEFRVKVTPELLEGILGGTWTPKGGQFGRVTLKSVYVTDDGYLEPEFVSEVPA